MSSTPSDLIMSQYWMSTATYHIHCIGEGGETTDSFVKPILYLRIENMVLQVLIGLAILITLSHYR